MPDARQWAETGEESKEGRCHAQAERRALALTDELAAGELIADHEGARARRVQNPHARLQLPCAREEGRQIDARVPIDARLEGLAVQDSPDAPRAVSWEVEFLTAVDPDVGHADVIPPIPPPDAQRRSDRHGGVATVVKEMKRVDRDRNTGNQERAARDVELLLIGEGESRGPRQPGRDVHRGWRQTDAGETLVGAGGREILPARAPDVQRSPGKPLIEIQARADLCRDFPGVERIALDERPVRRIVYVCVERRAR